MSPNEIEQAIREYLPEVMHMSLATTKGDSPWVCEVHFAYDDNLNLYFRSLASRRHSQEIESNPKVAGNIIMQHPLNLAPKGVYFEGSAKQLGEENELATAYGCIKHRLNPPGDILEEAKREDGHKFYKVAVHKYYLFDARDTKPSQKFELSWTGHVGR